MTLSESDIDKHDLFLVLSLGLSLSTGYLASGSSVNCSEPLIIVSYLVLILLMDPPFMRRHRRVTSHQSVPIFLLQCHP